MSVVSFCLLQDFSLGSAPQKQCGEAERKIVEAPSVWDSLPAVSSTNLHINTSPQLLLLLHAHTQKWSTYLHAQAIKAPRWGLWHSLLIIWWTLNWKRKNSARRKRGVQEPERPQRSPSPRIMKSSWLQAALPDKCEHRPAGLRTAVFSQTHYQRIITAYCNSPWKCFAVAQGSVSQFVASLPITDHRYTAA